MGRVAYCTSFVEFLKILRTNVQLIANVVQVANLAVKKRIETSVVHTNNKTRMDTDMQKMINENKQ